MKIWIDNKRPSPQDFVRCRNFAEAMILIDRCRYFRKIEVISIEQDLEEYTKDCEEYIKICDWLEEIGRNCPIHIHSASIENLRRIIRKRKKIIE